MTLTKPHRLPLVAPLRVHARYARDEVLAAFDRLRPDHPFTHRAGVFRDDPTDCDLFFVTLNKSEREFSPTTRYVDYAISPQLLHWQSQSTTSVRSPTGQRYLQQRQRGGRVLLFVREQKRTERGDGAPYRFLGPADYVSHEGDRPISFVRRLREEMPAAFFEAARVSAS